MTTERRKSSESLPEMTEIDYIQLALVFLGGSGLTGLLVTCWQTWEERRRQARAAFRELILTPDFRKLLAVFQMVGTLYDAQDEFKSQGQALVFVKESIVKITDQSQLDSLLADAQKEFLRIDRNVIDSGVPLMIPERMRKTILAIHKALGKMDARSTRDQIRLLSNQLRQTLGLKLLD